jgi:hypothetical protein
MEKIRLLKLVVLFVVSITFSNCKGDNKNKFLKTETVSSGEYDEVAFTKSFKTNDDIRELNIKYDNYVLKFRFIEDITLLQFIVDNKIVSDWKQILFNFQYLPDNFDGIRLLFNEKRSEGILLLPGYTEQFPNLIAYEFDINHFSYFNDFDIKDEDVNKIPFDNLKDEWRKGTFKVVKKGDKYTLTFIDASKKKILNFENSKSNDLLPEQELKKYVDKVLLFEKGNSSNEYNINEFEDKLKKEGFKKKFDKDCDLNNDKIKDKIVVFSTELSYNFKPSDFEESIVCVYISGKIFQNKNIILKQYVGNEAVGFSDVKIKDNFFTVEQVNGGGYSMVKEYTTFKFSNETNEIALHKYSRIETIRSEEDENEKIYNYTTKNFGNILFENYNSETILEKSNN